MDQTPTPTPKNPFDESIAILLRRHKFGDSRKVTSDEAVAVAASGEQLSPEAVAMTKRLFASKAYDAIGSLDNAMRASLERRSVPSVLRSAVVLVSYRLFDAVKEDIDRYVEKRAALVRDFVAGPYQAAIVEAAERLGPIFDRSQYPSPEAVAAAFSVEVSYVDFAVSGSLRKLRPELYEAEKAKLQAEMRSARDSIVQTMRAGLADLVGHLADKLRGVTAEGKPAIFRDSAVKNVTEWLDLFDCRDVAGDDDLRAIVERARRVLDGVDPDRVRKDMNTRETIGTQMEAIKASLDGLMMAKPSRRFDLSAESPVVADAPAE